MRRMLGLGVVAVLAAAVFGESPAPLPSSVGGPPAPPTAPMRAVVDDYLGVKVTDPYRYMENLADPEVVEWFKGQGAYATKYLTGLPGRGQLLKDITKYVNSAPALV